MSLFRSRSLTSTLHCARHHPSSVASPLTAAAYAVRFPNQRLFHFRRILAALRLPYDPLSELRPAPVIDAVICCHPKDYARLSHAVASLSLLPHSVERLHVIVPAWAPLPDLPRRAIVRRDHEIFSKNTLALLQERFLSRSGWLIQQGLKLFVALESDRPVLALDSDTRIASRRALVSEDGMQLLTPTLEFHQPYRYALMQLGISPTQNSFVPHWMLYQHDLLRGLFCQLGVSSVEDLLLKTLHLSLQSKSPISIDYELYAHYILGTHTQRVALARWSNCPGDDSGGQCRFAHTQSQHSYMDAPTRLEEGPR